MGGEIGYSLVGVQDNYLLVTGHAPYILVYGSNAVVPTEVRLISHRVQIYKEEPNDEMRKAELDMIDTEQELPQIRAVKYKIIIKAGYVKKVNPRKFKKGDLVLKRANALKPVGKFEPNWERPYIVTKVLKGRAYGLVDETRLPLPRPWNINMLKKFFV